jgi:hypothetical protein
MEDFTLSVYVAGKLTGISVAAEEQNVWKAIEAGELLLNAGFDPVIPHLMWYHDKRFTHGYERWMALCLAKLRKCHAVLFISASPGANKEEEHAKLCGIPVFKTLGDLVRWRRHREEDGA